jgi:hypothetical protein
MKNLIKKNLIKKFRQQGRSWRAPPLTHGAPAAAQS